MADVLIVGRVNHWGLEAELRRGGHRVEWHVNTPSALSSIRSRSFDLVITTPGALADSGLGMPPSMKPPLSTTPVLLLTASCHDGCNEPLDGGGCLLTPIGGERVLDVVAGLAPVRAARPAECPVLPAGVVAEDPITKALFAHVRAVAAVDSNVLVNGESGTGKEIVARMIHCHSDRRGQPFVPVNGGGLPDTLVESELFGHRRGAFTGAMAEKKGLVEEADKGVLFLDEIGEMPASMQVRLLRFLDTGELRRVGDTAARHVNVRVIAATNRDLHKAVRVGELRRDLYHRLGVVVRVPPLRERRGEIEPLVRAYAAECARRLGRPSYGVSDEAMALLCAHDWPGNIRELRNSVESAVIACTRERLLPADLPRPLRRAPAARNTDDDERRHVMAVLQQCGGHRGRAARMLSISRTTLWRKLHGSRSGTRASDAQISNPSSEEMC